METVLLWLRGVIQRLSVPELKKGEREREKSHLVGRPLTGSKCRYRRVEIVDGGTLGVRNEDKKRGQGSKDRLVGYSEVPVPHSFSDWVAGLVCWCLWCFGAVHCRG